MLAKKKASRFGGWSSTKSRKKRPKEAVETSPEDRSTDALQRLRRLVALENADTTLAAYHKARDLPAWSPPFGTSLDGPHQALAVQHA